MVKRTYIISKFKDGRILNSGQEKDRKRTTIAKRAERFRPVQYTMFFHPKGPRVQMPCAPGVLLLECFIRKDVVLGKVPDIYHELI